MVNAVLEGFSAARDLERVIVVFEEMTDVFKVAPTALSLLPLLIAANQRRRHHTLVHSSHLTTILLACSTKPSHLSSIVCVCVCVCGVMWFCVCDFRTSVLRVIGICSKPISLCLQTPELSPKSVHRPSSPPLCRQKKRLIVGVAMAWHGLCAVCWQSCIRS